MEPLRRQLMRLTIPIFMEIALVALVGFVDMFMLSSCGDGAVAAVGLASQIVMLVFLVYRFAASGVAVVCAQYHGAGLRKRLVEAVGVALIFNALLGFGVSAFLCLNAETILRMMGLREELMAEGAAYLRITGAFSFFQALGFTFSSSLRSVDRVRSPMVATAVANIVNVVGNYLLIYGHCGCPALGVVGAAWATAASQGVSMMILLVHHTRVHIRRYPRVWFRPFPWREFTGIFKIGLPAIGEEMSYCLSQAVTIYFINQISTEALTTRTYVANSVMFTYLFGVSAIQAGDILVGHLIGQHRDNVAYLLGNFFYRRAMAVSLCCSGALALAGPWVLGILTLNSEIIRLGTILFWIDCVLEIGRIRNIFACWTLRAAGDVIYPMTVGITFQWVIAVGVFWVVAIPLGFGLVGAWVVFAIDENVRGCILLRRWHAKAWFGKSLA